ncbi:hypothetical protein ACHQM5_022393 [Ranunculus cassubicifolius]
MDMKSVKKVGMGGFMCSSQATTAVCMTAGDSRSVIVPRRHVHSSFVDHSMLMNNTSKYSRLAESRRRSISLGDRRSVSLSNALKREREQREHERVSSRPPRSLSLPSQQGFQEVVMRVSIHCQGCAGKIKKHLSKMEGVTSFSIDLETKRVTVRGHVTPMDVLESISKVKNAEILAG